MSHRLTEAYNTLMLLLYGEIPEHIQGRVATRVDYTNALRKTEEQHHIQQGDADYLEWVLILIGRSPLIIEDTEGGL